MKRRIFLLLIAVLATTVLWYTRPVTIAGTLDVKKLTSVEVALSIPQADGTSIQQEKTYHLSAAATDPLFTALLRTLEEIPSHASLTGILFFDHLPPYDEEGYLSIGFHTEQDVTTLLLLHNSGYFHWGNRTTCLSGTERVYAVDEGTFDALADLIKGYVTNSGAA